MDCQLPVTGSGPASTVVIAVFLLLAGAGILIIARHRGVRSVLPIVVLLVAGFGVASARPAAAGSNCAATTVSAPSTTQVSPSSAAVTSTTIAATTSIAAATTVAPPTTIGVVTFCGSLIPNDGGGFAIDIFITMTGGAGTFVALAPSTGACDGEVQNSGLVVDADVFNPTDYCAANAPGSQVFQAASAGAWTPAIPVTWYACVPPDNPPDTTTTTIVDTTTTTTTIVDTTTTITIVDTTTTTTIVDTTTTTTTTV